MRALVQRVSSARVLVGAEEVGAIGAGMLTLLGVAAGDSDGDRDWIVRKLLALRIFADEGGKMNRSLVDTGGSMLLVSQFTLCADVGGGTRPSFGGAMEPVAANAMFETVLEQLAKAVPVATGRFGAHMQVQLTNDGPVTLWLDSRRGS